MGENDKLFEAAPLPAEKHDEPFKDFMQEVDDMLVNLTLEELEAVPDDNQNPELQFAENLHFHAEDYDPADHGFNEMQQTFLAIMQQVLRPVSRYIKAILSGVEAREIFEVMNFTVAPLVDKVEQVQLMRHTADLLHFRSTLTRILATHFGSLSPELLKQLVSSFMLVKDAFQLELRGNQRAVANILNFYRLLCFSKEVEVEQIRKFFAIGIPSLTWVRRTPAAEIAGLSGMDLKQARLLRKMALAFRELSEEETAQAEQNARGYLPNPSPSA